MNIPTRWKSNNRQHLTLQCHDIIIINQWNYTSNVRCIQPDESLLYLGHTSQPGGNPTETFNIPIKTAETFDQRIISSTVTRNQIRMVNNSIINLIIRYPLAPTSFTDNIIDKFHKSIHPSVILGIYYSSRRPEELRYRLHHH